MQTYSLPYNFLALAYKPSNISSFSFANAIKTTLKKQGFPIKKIGFSGTLDPFARGMLILGVNGCTKLFPHIKKSYKTYRAVLFLGLESASLDIENIICLHEMKSFSSEQIHKALKDLHGTISYIPPKFSAKHINGVRAYELARNGKDFRMQETTMHIKELKLLQYIHPFLSFEVCVSEGAYVRSIAEIIANNLGVKGSLCYLERTKEGEWDYKEILKQAREISLNHDTQSSVFNAPEQVKLSRDFYFNDQTLLQENTQLINRNWKNSSNFSFFSLDLMQKGIMQNTKLILLDIKNALKYDTIRLTQYTESASNGAKIILDHRICAGLFSRTSEGSDCGRFVQDGSIVARSGFQNIQENVQQDSKNSNYCANSVGQEDTEIFLADFGTFFGIIKISQNGEIKYILNRIDKC